MTLCVQSCQPFRFLQNYYDFLLFVTLYSENYDKSASSCNSSMWCSPVTVLVIRLACLYFGEYPQAVTCSAQPLWCLSHSSCSRLHGLKAFAAPANLNGAFFWGPWMLWGLCILPMQEILSFIQCFLLHMIAKKYGSGPGPKKSVTLTLGTCGFCLQLVSSLEH